MKGRVGPLNGNDSCWLMREFWLLPCAHSLWQSCDESPYAMSRETSPVKENEKNANNISLLKLTDQL